MATSIIKNVQHIADEGSMLSSLELFIKAIGLIPHGWFSLDVNDDFANFTQWRSVQIAEFGNIATPTHWHFILPFLCPLKHNIQ